MAAPARIVALGAGAATAGVTYWMRKHPEALPYSLRLFVQGPHPLITRDRLREILDPQPRDRILEVGPGTGYYTLDLARWVGDEGAVEILDVQQEYLDHTIRRAREQGLWNVTPNRADAQALPHDDASFDAAILITVLGEIPNQDAALGELARVLRPGGRLVVGELALGDPHYVAFPVLRRRAEAAGLSLDRRVGPMLGYFARFSA
jgi:SAM-dependent methyltransferase